jgi:SPP1 gp7 family putative phage head morphogenesis protein
MKYLKPILTKDNYFNSVEKKIKECFEEIIYNRIESIYKDDFKTNRKIFNAKTTEIEKALKDFKIQYINNEFVGQFNSQISKELRDLGAKFNARNKSYFLENYKIPNMINSLILKQNSKLTNFNEKLTNFLYQTSENLKYSPIVINFNNDVEKILTDLDFQLENTVSRYILTSELTPRIKKKISENYTYNLNLYIKDFVSEQTLNLREKMMDLYMNQGLRSEAIKDLLLKSYNISQKKAKFLAIEETNLLCAQYRQQRYQEVGLTDYKWTTAKDSRVRSSHKELDGKIFSWSNPPIIDGRRVNPGEDWGCRCLAVPILN